MINNTQDLLAENKEVFIGILADRYCRTILQSTLHKPKSAIEIGREHYIPISTVYRRLQILQDNKLVKPSGSISEEGKKYFLYKSRINRISAVFNGTELQVSLLVNSD